MTSAKSLFEDEELELLKKVAKRDNIDLENSTDLLNSDIEELAAAPPQKTEKEISQLPQDKIFRSKEDFSFENFLPQKESFEPISKERREELEKENTEIYNGYLMWQTMQPDFKLHVKVSQDEESGEMVWYEKSFKYHPITKGQKLRLDLKNARILDLTRRKNELLQKPFDKLTNEEKYELNYFNTLVNIAQYKFEELQAKLYFNMNAEDFATVNTAEYTWALSAAKYKENFSPFSTRKHPTPSSAAKTSMSYQ